MVYTHCATLLHLIALGILCKEQSLEVCSCRGKNPANPLIFVFIYYSPLLFFFSLGGGGDGGGNYMASSATKNLRIDKGSPCGAHAFKTITLVMTYNI